MYYKKIYIYIVFMTVNDLLFLDRITCHIFLSFRSNSLLVMRTTVDIYIYIYHVFT